IRNLVSAVGEPFNQIIFLKTIWASVLVTALSLANAYPLSFILVRGGRAAWVGAIVIGILIPFWVNDILKAFAWQLLLARFGPINNLLTGAGSLAEPFPFLNLDGGFTLCPTPP